MPPGVSNQVIMPNPRYRLVEDSIVHYVHPHGMGGFQPVCNSSRASRKSRVLNPSVNQS
jgi:hypothetical protein